MGARGDGGGRARPWVAAALGLLGAQPAALAAPRPGVLNDALRPRLQLSLAELMPAANDLTLTLRRLNRVRRAQVAALVEPLARPAGSDSLRMLPWWQEGRALGFYQPMALEAADGRWLALDTVSLPALQPGRSQAGVGLDLRGGWLGDLIEPGGHLTPAPQPPPSPAGPSDGQPGLAQ